MLTHFTTFLIFVFFILFTNVSLADDNTIASSYRSYNKTFPRIPDQTLSPGDLCTTSDRDFCEFRYNEQIPYCERNVSYEQRNEICLKYGITDRRNFIVDHVIPLNLGGSNHPSNLWCQHRSIDTASLELELFNQIRTGRISQERAIGVIFQCKFHRNCPNFKPSRSFKD